MEAKDVLQSDYFTCPHDGCQKVYKCGRRFVCHLKTAHNEVAKFDCTVCTKSFLSYESLRGHMKIDHLGFTIEEQEMNKCKICSKVFPNKSRLMFHLERVHTANETAECLECKKKFTNRFIFLAHVKRHNEEAEGLGPSYPCTECDKSYKSKNGLKLHVDSVHLEKKDHVCDVCAYKTHCPNQFRSHQLQHDPTREKKYSCSDCDMLFYCPRDVQRHSVVHTPNRHCPCPYCGMSLTPTSLNRHIRVQHRDMTQIPGKAKGQPCPICGKNFKTREYLRQHLRSKAHGGTGRHQNQVKSKNKKQLEPKNVPRAEGKPRSSKGQGQPYSSPLDNSDPSACTAAMTLPILTHPSFNYPFSFGSY